MFLYKFTAASDREETINLGKNEPHRCTIEDVKTRVFICNLYVIFVFLAIVYAFAEIVKGSLLFELTS